MLRSGDDGRFHRPSVPLSVRLAQPHSVHDFLYGRAMRETIDRPYIWKNICALMGEEDPSLDRVVERTGVGRGSLQRIRSGDASSRLATLEAVAKSFGLSVWQLLVPGITKEAPPKLALTQQEELREMVKTEAQAAVAAALAATKPEPSEEAQAARQALSRKLRTHGAR